MDYRSKMTTQFDTVILSPHADDEVLGAFSFLNEQSLVIYFGVEERKNISRDKRISEIEAISSKCNFAYRILKFEVNNYNVQELIGPLENLINEVKPQRILIPEISYNQDHRVVYQAAITALRPHDINHFVSQVLIYEQLHSFIWPLDKKFTPNYFIPVNIEEKIEAYKLHASQIREHRSIEKIKNFAAIRGAMCNRAYAESFFIKRMTLD